MHIDHSADQALLVLRTAVDVPLREDVVCDSNKKCTVYTTESCDSDRSHEIKWPPTNSAALNWEGWHCASGCAAPVTHTVLHSTTLSNTWLRALTSRKSTLYTCTLPILSSTTRSSIYSVESNIVLSSTTMYNICSVKSSSTQTLRIQI